MYFNFAFVAEILECYHTASLHLSSIKSNTVTCFNSNNLAFLFKLKLAVSASLLPDFLRSSALQSKKLIVLSFRKTVNHVKSAANYAHLISRLK